MTKQKVSVVFDKRKNVEKYGFSYVEIKIYLSRKERKYFGFGKCKSKELKSFTSSQETKDKIKRCKDIIAAMSLFGDPLTIKNFELYYQEKKLKIRNERSVFMRQQSEGHCNGVDFLSIQR